MSIDYSNVGYYSRVWGDVIDNGYENMLAHNGNINSGNVHTKTVIISFIKIAIALYLVELCKKYDIELKR